MIKFLIKILSNFFILAGVFIIHIWVSNVLPYPFDHLNIIFAFLFIFLLIQKTEKVIWYVLIFGLWLELFVSSSFGVTLFSLFVCFLTVDWLLTYFLTNRSFYTISLTAIVSIFIYRIYFLGLNAIFNLFIKKNFLYTSRTVADYIYEAVLTSIFIIVFYLFLSIWFKKLNPKYIGHI